MLLSALWLVHAPAVRADTGQRIPCVRTADGQAMTRGAVTGSTVSARTGRVRVPVILVSFSDVSFFSSDVRARWEAMTGRSGYAENGAAGSVSDYFREQSQGRFEIAFDVLGPFQLAKPESYYGENLGGGRASDRRPAEMVYHACQAAAGQTSLSPYDWDGDGVIDVVMIVFAGLGENREGEDWAIWPHKSEAGGYQVGTLRLGSYACVAELRAAATPDGYGTFCHEFAHTLGLPDLYPVSGEVFSIFDEWDLMDGGNFINGGWSPPHFSAFERNLCGWLDLSELTVPTSVAGMPSMDEQPLAYVIRNDAHPTDYYILENRQQRGFDALIPGRGLLVTHVVDYSGTLFPNTASDTQVGLVPADNRGYEESKAFFRTRNADDTFEGRSLYLSMAGYPYVTPDSVNDRLTDSSLPAMTLGHVGTDGHRFLSKPVTAIRQGDDGRLSFDFMKETTGVASPAAPEARPVAYYDLRGQRLQGRPVRPGIYVVRYSDGTTKKRIR